MTCASIHVAVRVSVRFSLANRSVDLQVASGADPLDSHHALARRIPKSGSSSAIVGCTAEPQVPGRYCADRSCPRLEAG